MSTCYRFGVFDMEQLVLIDGHLVYGEPALSYALWTYDYDCSTQTYSVDGYLELKYPLSVDEVRELHFLAEHGCFYISPASENDKEYYEAIHSSVRAGWQPANGSPVETAYGEPPAPCSTPATDVELYTEETLPHCDADLHCCMQDEDDELAAALAGTN